jgi:hypothetical protein
MAALGGVAGVAAYERSSDGCCALGAPCCHPGAACCLAHHRAASIGVW